MRVLVAGGAGFVGSHLCRRLLTDLGHEVICVDNLSTGRRANIADLEGRSGFQFIWADITEQIIPEPPDVIVHLASPASPVDYDRMKLETLEANSLGTAQLLNLAARAGARFVFASTSEVYGDPLVHPQPETYWGNVDPIGPRSCYDEGKRFGEALVTAYRADRGVRAAILRIFNTYGPAMRLDDGRVIPAFISAARAGRPYPVHGDGTQTRSYMYVSDLVEGLVAVASDPELDGLVANVGNPDELTVDELAGVFGMLTGQVSRDWLPARPGDPRQRRPDITLFSERYGWAPKVTLQDGLRRTLDERR